MFWWKYQKPFFLPYCFVSACQTWCRTCFVFGWELWRNNWDYWLFYLCSQHRWWRISRESSSSADQNHRVSSLTLAAPCPDPSTSARFRANFVLILAFNDQKTFLAQFVSTDNYQRVKFSFFTAKTTVNAISPWCRPTVSFKALARILSLLPLASGAKSCLQTTPRLHKQIQSISPLDMPSDTATAMRSLEITQRVHDKTSRSKARTKIALNDAINLGPKSLLNFAV